MIIKEAIEELKEFKHTSWDGMPEEVIDMAISALEQITQIRKAIVEAEEENLHLSYPVWCFMRKIEKIVGEKEMED